MIRFAEVALCFDHKKSSGTYSHINYTRINLKKKHNKINSRVNNVLPARWSFIMSLKFARATSYWKNEPRVKYDPVI